MAAQRPPRGTPTRPSRGLTSQTVREGYPAARLQSPDAAAAGQGQARLQTKTPFPQSVGVAPSHEKPASQLAAFIPQVSVQESPAAQSKAHEVASHSMAQVTSLPLQSREQLELDEAQTTLVLLLVAVTVHEPLAAHCTEQSSLSEQMTSQLEGLSVQVKAAEVQPRHSRSHEEELSQVGAQVVPMLHKASQREPPEAQVIAGQSQPQALQA